MVQSDETPEPASAKRVSAAELDFGSAPAYRKIAKVPVANIVIAKGGEKVTTLQKRKDGREFVETTNVAKAGDAILNRAPGDSYVVSAASFAKLYEIDPDDATLYRSKSFGRAVRMLEDAILKAPWGKDQHIEAGGVVYFNQANGEIIGNQMSTFARDFAREARDGSLIALSEPLAAQLAWAKAKGETAHERDIESGMKAAFKSTTVP